MHPNTVNYIINRSVNNVDILLTEGVMGLFDGAINGSSSTADISTKLGLPVLLVIDCSGMGSSVSALAEGFAKYRSDVVLGGVILNRVNSKRHEIILKESLDKSEIAVLGVIPESAEIHLPSRYLGLIQAGEYDDLENTINRIADIIISYVDIEKILKIISEVKTDEGPFLEKPIIPPLSTNIAIASDDAFTFTYPDLLDSWHNAGSHLTLFSPLADETPDVNTGAIYLPGGYPELHAKQLSESHKFLSGLREAAENDKIIYGECGGYMVMGKSIMDYSGNTYDMANLFPIHTSLKEKKLTLGYRNAKLAASSPLGKLGSIYKGHEFHYATIQNLNYSESLFTISDAKGNNIGNSGSRIGNIMGSFIHLIDNWDK
mgnify:CR=1 FL=1|tara:strand:+ start:72666 stop:73790 length:1125 start_codon:yes stop_codon:yes gene_type:complete